MYHYILERWYLTYNTVHCVNSNAKGEIQYARYVYANTAEDDTTIRRPVASFWAHRSHVLRAEAEDEFRKMCLEFPQFGFDVLSKFYQALFLIILVSHADDFNSPRLGREAQERDPRETAQYPKRQLSQAPKAYPDLGLACDVTIRGVNNCLATSQCFDTIWCRTVA